LSRHEMHARFELRRRVRSAPTQPTLKTPRVARSMVRKLCAFRLRMLTRRGSPHLKERRTAGEAWQAARAQKGAGARQQPLSSALYKETRITCYVVSVPRQLPEITPSSRHRCPMFTPPSHTWRKEKASAPRHHHHRLASAHPVPARHGARRPYVRRASRQVRQERRADIRDRTACPRDENSSASAHRNLKRRAMPACAATQEMVMKASPEVTETEPPEIFRQAVHPVRGVLAERR